jgi:hypothetical protein
MQLSFSNSHHSAVFSRHSPIVIIQQYSVIIKMIISQQSLFTNIQQLEEAGNTRLMNQEIKWLMKQQRKNRTQIAIIEDENGELHTEEEKVGKVWSEYIQKLYGDDKRDATACEQS